MVVFMAHMGEERRIPAFLSSQSQIIFLGSGSGKYLRGKQLRSTGGIVIQTLGNQIILDAGPGTICKAAQYGVNLRDTTAILISHNHLGHAGDLNALIDALTYGGTDPQGVLVSNKTIINSDQSMVSYLNPYYNGFLEKLITLEKDQKVGINEIEVYATQANHGDMNAIGFKIITPEFILGYTGDTELSPNLADYYKGCHILIINIVNPRAIQETGNLCSVDAITLINKAKPNLVIMTHFSSKMLEGDPMYEAREIQKATNIQVIAAKDGMVISPSAYATQKTLSSF
jgi:ribonuclease BN (tRNA processing enzyme)